MHFSIDGGGGGGFLGFWIILGVVGIAVTLAVIFFQKTEDVIEGERPTDRPDDPVA